ncbi:MAG: PEP-CTERM sorting domain-containing protein [Burkholderiaceae bacterium]|nr:PEP-CTERM sorting domain-containing protein [Burkholderiaceae bacterium]
MLTITFDQVVHLSSIGLRAEGHNYTNWAAGDTFLFNGVSTLLPDNVGAIATSMTGQQFTFAFGGAQANEFYLSSMTVSAVPEPETYALMLAGMAVIGFVMRRRMPRA